ncbi:hypothetical protein D044_3887A, partial [Vibrio parahaemolyticus EKP-026]
MVRITPV